MALPDKTILPRRKITPTISVEISLTTTFMSWKYFLENPIDPSG
jgi:hypothetical protein